jgi:hypothetical protein
MCWVNSPVANHIISTNGLRTETMTTAQRHTTKQNAYYVTNTWRRRQRLLFPPELSVCWCWQPLIPLCTALLLFEWWSLRGFCAVVPELRKWQWSQAHFRSSQVRRFSTCRKNLIVEYSGSPQLCVFRMKRSVNAPTGSLVGSRGSPDCREPRMRVSERAYVRHLGHSA